MNTQNNVSSNAWTLSKSVLKSGSLAAAVELIGPGAETPESVAPTERLLYAAQGAVTVITGVTHTMLNTDEVQLVPAGVALAVRNHAPTPARVLSVALRAQPAEAGVVFPA